MQRPLATRVLSVLVLSASAWAGPATNGPSWHPALPGAVNGTLTLTTDEFLAVPPKVAEEAQQDGAAPFIVAKEAPTVDVALCDGLEMNKTLHPWWSAWGDICVAGDGRVYSGVGDHGDEVAGTSQVYIYRWDPKTKQLSRIIDVNSLVKREKGEPTFAKLHGRMDEGADGRIYFTATLNNGPAARDEKYKWSDVLPGGQLYAYDPKTDRTEIVANLPARRCSLASRLDRRRNVWWCNLDGEKADALWAYDLTKKKEVFRGPDGSVSMNRNFALARDGSVYFNGAGSVIWKYHPKSNSIGPTKSRFQGQFMRCSTDQSARGDIHGITVPEGMRNKEFNLFRYHPRTDKLEMLGKELTTGHYTTVCALSPDEKYVYYIPGAPGVPVVQYDIARKQRKVIAFLGEPIEKRTRHILGSVFGLKPSADGATLYAHTNGYSYPGDKPASEAELAKVGWSVVSFVAIHIPASER
jgi:hypothetical protein